VGTGFCHFVFGFPAVCFLFLPFRFCFFVSWGGRYIITRFCTHPPCKGLVGRRGGGVLNQPLIRRTRRLKKNFTKKKPREKKSTKKKRPRKKNSRETEIPKYPRETENGKIRTPSVSSIRTGPKVQSCVCGRLHFSLLTNILTLSNKTIPKQFLLSVAYPWLRGTIPRTQYFVHALAFGKSTGGRILPFVFWLSFCLFFCSPPLHPPFCFLFLFFVSWGGRYIITRFCTHPPCKGLVGRRGGGGT